MDKTYGLATEATFHTSIQKKETLVALGCKSLYKAAAAQVNNNGTVLRRRRSRRFMERMKSMDRWTKGRAREKEKRLRMRADCH